MSPTIANLKGGAAVAADMAATKRSILRYLARYERDWERDEVGMPAWHFVMCTPSEEGGKRLIRGRVHNALGQLRAEGLLHRRKSYDAWALTDAGREAGKALL